MDVDDDERAQGPALLPGELTSHQIGEIVELRDVFIEPFRQLAGFNRALALGRPVGAPDRQDGHRGPALDPRRAFLRLVIDQ